MPFKGQPGREKKKREELYGHKYSDTDVQVQIWTQMFGTS